VSDVFCIVANKNGKERESYHRGNLLCIVIDCFVVPVFVMVEGIVTGK